MDVRDDRPERGRDAEAGLRALRGQVTILVGRLGDAAAAREAERRFDVLAAEIRSDEPLADVARVAGTGIVIAATPWDDLGVACARLVDELLAVIEDAPAWDAVDEEAWAAAAEPEAEAPDEAGSGAEGIGGPIYPPDDE